MNQLIAFYLQRCFVPVRDQVSSAARFTDASLDVIAACTLAMQALNGAATSERRLLLRLASHVALQSELVRPQDLELVDVHLWKLDQIADLQANVRRACSTSLIFWHRDLLPLYLADVYRNPAHAAGRLQFLFDALHDIEPQFRASIQCVGRVRVRVAMRPKRARSRRFPSSSQLRRQGLLRQVPERDHDDAAAHDSRPAEPRY